MTIKTFSTAEIPDVTYEFVHQISCEIMEAFVSVLEKYDLSEQLMMSALQIAYAEMQAGYCVTSQMKESDIKEWAAQCGEDLTQNIIEIAKVRKDDYNE